MESRVELTFLGSGTLFFVKEEHGMFEQNFDHEDRYIQQGRRNAPYFDRRQSSRGYEDERFENQDRYRSRGQDFYRGQEQNRRYTRPDYDSDLDIERPGQARFGSRGSYGSSYGNEYGSNESGREYSRDFGRGDSGRDFGRDYGQNHGQNYGQNYGRDYGQNADYENSERWNRPSSRSQRFQERNEPTYRSDTYRDWEGSSVGHADWNARGDYRSGSQDQSWGRGSNDQQSRLNEQKNRWPKSFKRNDERLKDDIHEELIRHGRIDASDIEVQVKEGEVTLTGQVTSRHDKRIAEELAEKVLGVHDVQNQLKVKQQQQQQGDDQQRSGSPSLPGSNRASSLGGQQDQSKAANSSSK